MRTLEACPAAVESLFLRTDSEFYQYLKSAKWR